MTVLDEKTETKLIKILKNFYEGFKNEETATAAMIIALAEIDKIICKKENPSVH